MKKKTFKKIFIIVTCVILALALSIGGYAVYYRFFAEPKGDTATQEFKRLANEYDEISYNEDTGSAYVNNEIIIIADEDATKADIEALAKKHKASIGEALEDINVYKIVFSKNLEYNQLEDYVKAFSSSPSVDEAYISDVSLLEEDALDDLEAQPPVYPKDPWDSDAAPEWNIEKPDGINWSLEAINAPAGWGYLNQAETVKIGLIDTMVDMTHDDLSVKKAYVTLTDQETNELTFGSITNSNIPADDHGTHVAGTMMATWNEEGIPGIMGDKGELYYSVAYNIDNSNNRIIEYTTPYNYFKAIMVLVELDVQSINISQNTDRLIGFAASHGNKNAISYLENQAKISGALLERFIQKRKAENKKDFVICISAGNSNHIEYCVNKKAKFGYELLTKNNATNPREKGGSLAKYNNYLSLIDIPEVKDRILVVGSVGLTEHGYCSYSYFSNVGDRVDIVAPGEKIYSLIPGGYKPDDGTSMSAPHVTAAAGLVFGCNPELDGTEVKKIVCASVKGRYYYQGGYSGLLDLEAIMRNGLSTKEHSVNRVVNPNTQNGMDVCFVVDTTGSMGDDINNAKDNMSNILDALSEKTTDFRVALIDYRDFPDRTYSESDYAADVKLDFSNNIDDITQSISDLNLGYGGDENETVFSGLIQSLKLSWREDSKKVIIILGDAPPLDPEPYTDYTYEQVVAALYEANLNIDTENSDDRVLGDAEDSLINVYSIGTSNSSDSAESFFNEISTDTGGTFTTTSDPSQISDAIVDSIEKVEIIELQTVDVNFGEDKSNEIVELYDDDSGELCFTFPLDKNGKFELENMAAGEYFWEIRSLNANGNLTISEGKTKAKISHEKDWYDFIFVLWNRHRIATIVVGILIVIAIVFIIIGIKKIKKLLEKIRAQKQTKKEAAKSKTAPPMQPTITPPSVSTVRFCPKCGAKHTGTEKFCGSCGAKLSN